MRSDLCLVGDQQHGAAGRLEGLDHLDQRVERQQVDAGGGFVQDRQPRLHREHGREFHPFAFAAAQGLVRCAACVPRRIQSHAAQTVLHALPPGADAHIVADAQPFEAGGFLPGQRDSHARALVHLQGVDAPAVENDFPRIGPIALAAHDGVGEAGFA